MSAPIPSPTNGTLVGVAVGNTHLTVPVTIITDGIGSRIGKGIREGIGKGIGVGAVHASLSRGVPCPATHATSSKTIGDTMSSIEEKSIQADNRVILIVDDSSRACVSTPIKSHSRLASIWLGVRCASLSIPIKVNVAIVVRWRIVGVRVVVLVLST